ARQFFKESSGATALFRLHREIAQSHFTSPRIVSAGLTSRGRAGYRAGMKAAPGAAIFILAGFAVASNPTSDRGFGQVADERQVTVPYRQATNVDGSRIERGIVVNVVTAAGKDENMIAWYIERWQRLTVVEVNTTLGTVTLKAATKQIARAIRRGW